MTRETLAAALETAGFKTANQSYPIPEGRDATLFISAPGDVMPIGRVLKIDLGHAAFVRIETTKEEQLFFAYEDVLGLRLLSAPAAKERSAGFGR